VRWPIVAALATAAALVAASPAAADSIAYIKDGNVWLSTSDGGRQFQVTDTGGYSDVSQADDGTMIALKGVRLHRLDRQGNVTADFDTPVSDTRPAGERQFFGPFDPAISPDGQKVAYTYYWNSQTQDPSCFPPECMIALNEGGTGYSWSDRQTGWDDPALGKHSGWRFPAWVDNDTTLLGNPTHMPNFDVILDTISDGGSGNLVHNWFSDMADGNPGVGGGDITRDKRKLAFQTGTDNSTLTLYSVGTFPTSFRDSEASPSERPSPCYRYSNPAGGQFSQPTFSPDGGQLAWSAGDGVHVVTVPSFDGGCTLDGATPEPPLVIAGGSNPDWGPAGVPTKREGGSSLAVKVKRGGRKLSVTVPAAGRLAVVAKSKGAVLAKAKARNVRPGTRSITLKLTRKGRRTLARKGSAKVTVRVAFTPKGGAKQVVTRKAKLKR
jgi:hypothetical protein